jgi:CBS domain-containing protein
MTLVRDIMVKNVVSADQEFTLHETFHLMTQIGIGSVVITEEGKPVGIFTQKDILFKVYAKGAEYTERVGNHMSAPLISIRPDQQLKEAAQIMTQLKIRHLPVIDDDHLVGIISNRDILRALSNDMPDM